MEKEENSECPRRSTRSKKDEGDLICQICGLVSECRALANIHMRNDHSDHIGITSSTEPQDTKDVKMIEKIELPPPSIPPKKKRGRKKKVITEEESNIKTDLGTEVNYEGLPDLQPSSSELSRPMTTKELINGVRGGSSVTKKRNRSSTTKVSSPVTNYESSSQNTENASSSALTDDVNNSDDKSSVIYGFKFEDPNFKYTGSMGENPKKNTGKMGAPKKSSPKSKKKTYTPSTIPTRLVEGDPKGKYECYVKDCGWKGNYRSLRMEHLRVLHPGWKMPSRFLLQRISKDGIYINEDEYVPPFACHVEGCSWRGNYRASRSSHMRQQHRDIYEEKRKKAGVGGYVTDGQYFCHVPDCTWRGASRTTRASHIRKCHPDWIAKNDVKQSQFVCFWCGASTRSSGALLNHVETSHGISMIVDLTFHYKSEFLDWFKKIETIFHCDFSKKESTKAMVGKVKYELRCTVGSKSETSLVASARNYAYNTNFLSKRETHVHTRKSIHCCSYLEITEETISNKRKITVSGVLEHTGHGFGTPLLRMDSFDRQVFHQFLEVRNSTYRSPSSYDIIELFNEMEGGKIENMEPKTFLDGFSFQPQHRNQFYSLLKLIMNGQISNESVFDVDIVSTSDNPDGSVKTVIRSGLTVGYMDQNMKDLYMTYGSMRYMIAEKITFQFKEGPPVYTIICYVPDTFFISRCCLIYFTTDLEKGFNMTIKKLAEINAEPPKVIMTDVQKGWITSLKEHFPNFEVDVIIPPWCLLEYWGEIISEYAIIDYDRFYLIAALRRLLMVTDSEQFLFFVVELFEAFHEYGFHKLTEFIDAQLSNKEYFQMWSPFKREAYEELFHPTVVLSTRLFRDEYLTRLPLNRFDQFVVMAIERIKDFNSCPPGETYTNQPMNEERTVYYESFLPERNVPEKTDAVNSEANNSAVEYAGETVEQKSSKRDDEIVQNTEIDVVDKPTEEAQKEHEIIVDSPKQCTDDDSSQKCTPGADFENSKSKKSPTPILKAPQRDLPKADKSLSEPPEVAYEVVMNDHSYNNSRSGAPSTSNDFDYADNVLEDETVDIYCDDDDDDDYSDDSDDDDNEDDEDDGEVIEEEQNNQVSILPASGEERLKNALTLKKKYNLDCDEDIKIFARFVTKSDGRRQKMLGRRSVVAEDKWNQNNSGKF